MNSGIRQADRNMLHALKPLAPLIAGLSLSGLCAAPAKALWLYVGSWEVGDPAAPIWSENSPSGPLAYTGQEAAALLFGGSAADYAISTLGSDPATIDHQAWYSVWGGPGKLGTEDYSNKYQGLYYGPISGGAGTASAFVRDWCGSQIRAGLCGSNFAFRFVNPPVPAPAPLPVLGVSSALIVSRSLRKRFHRKPTLQK